MDNEQYYTDDFEDLPNADRQTGHPKANTHQAKVATATFVDLIKHIATDENEIERLRNDLAHCKDFEPKVLFEKIDSSKNGTISAHELKNFMHEHHVQHINEQECKEIIDEFDNNVDGQLNYNEFLNIFLPATNAALRDYCLYGDKETSHHNDNSKPLKSTPLPHQVATLVIKILEKEIDLKKKRLQAKVDLHHSSIEKVTLQHLFNEISRGKKFITVPDLQVFLEQHNYYPRKDNIEALLRRCDQDSDAAISYDEYMRLVETEDQKHHRQKEELDKAKQHNPNVTLAELKQQDRKEHYEQELQDYHRKNNIKGLLSQYRNVKELHKSEWINKQADEDAERRKEIEARRLQMLKQHQAQNYGDYGHGLRQKSHSPKKAQELPLSRPAFDYAKEKEAIDREYAERLANLNARQQEEDRIRAEAERARRQEEEKMKAEILRAIKEKEAESSRLRQELQMFEKDRTVDAELREAKENYERMKVEAQEQQTALRNAGTDAKLTEIQILRAQLQQQQAYGQHMRIQYHQPQLYGPYSTSCVPPFATPLKQRVKSCSQYSFYR